ncbi:hypothetical protein Hamer_G009992 [Homarus americanus]|uniref:Uncharacterized protein n=1 Tax=Homarus americanus TaxID=6706 RepID=A0A8J5JFA4_HOMAM|nr:hypothetical protein Hamer_G009992 [Homarus americanus]
MVWSAIIRVNLRWCQSSLGSTCGGIGQPYGQFVVGSAGSGVNLWWPQQRAVQQVSQNTDAESSTSLKKLEQTENEENKYN